MNRKRKEIRRKRFKCLYFLMWTHFFHIPHVRTFQSHVPSGTNKVFLIESNFSRCSRVQASVRIKFAMIRV